PCAPHVRVGVEVHLGVLQRLAVHRHLARDRDELGAAAGAARREEAKEKGKGEPASCRLHGGALWRKGSEPPSGSRATLTARRMPEYSRQGSATTRPSRCMHSRCSVTRSSVSDRNRTEPSPKAKLAPPGWWLPKTLIRR